MGRAYDGLQRILAKMDGGYEARGLWRTFELAVRKKDQVVDVRICFVEPTGNITWDEAALLEYTGAKPAE
eukprot:5628657-Lingulodinium_polyedra.AAC.1